MHYRLQTDDEGLVRQADPPPQANDSEEHRARD
jgi:hypothetical protein